MVLIDTSCNPIASRIFEVELWTIDGTRKTIKNTFEPCLHIRHIKQCASIKKNSELFCIPEIFFIASCAELYETTSYP